MDNVLNIEKCKICGGLVRIESTAFRTSKLCTCCGYFYNKEKNISEEKCECSSCNEENYDLEKVTESSNPCGAYKLVTISGVAKSGTLGENLSEEEVLRMFNFSDTSRLNMNKTYINYRNPKTNEFKVIFGNGKPETYNEFVGKL
ncbi:hypothetical protein [Clostridium sp. 1001271B_151109_B4]|uniref:hypothetical protein n=1 Tax=Clostridium sp. 1001271B_151109_B4 TaxID=2787148 RepID=UPI0018ABCDCC|nr:hypothetical protein [Clostridium sp. 1001271B_151109_B4]